MEFPEDLKYASTRWCRSTAVATIGITDHAQGAAR